VNELLDEKTICVWLYKSVCKIPEDKSCPVDCSLKGLIFEQDSILAKIKEEEMNIANLKKEGMFRNRQKIRDSVMGIYVLEKTLKEHFNFVAPHVVDKDVEKTGSVKPTAEKKIEGLPPHGWRQLPKKRF
jgi:hypothetical protein